MKAGPEVERARQGLVTLIDRSMMSRAEGEHLTREQWEDAAGRVLTAMRLADHQAVLIAHRDTEKEHVHIVVNRIDDDGLAWRPFRDMTKAHEAIPGIEIEYDLSRTGREQAPPDLSAGAYRETMRTGVQARIKDTTFPADASKQIQTILRRSSPWAIAKSTGRNCVPNGQPTRACDHLMSNLRALGVYVVPDGELESFARSVDGRGPSWVNEVLNKDLKSDPELEGARAFVSLVAFPRAHAEPTAPSERDA